MRFWGMQSRLQIGFGWAMGSREVEAVGSAADKGSRKPIAK